MTLRLFSRRKSSRKVAQFTPRTFTLLRGAHRYRRDVSARLQAKSRILLGGGVQLLIDEHPDIAPKGFKANKKKRALPRSGPASFSLRTSLICFQLVQKAIDSQRNAWLITTFLRTGVGSHLRP